MHVMVGTFSMKVHIADLEYKNNKKINFSILGTYSEFPKKYSLLNYKTNFVFLHMGLISSVKGLVS
jgi:hypothetical protein